MLTRYAIVIFIVYATVLLFIEQIDLALAFYVLFPLFLIPYFYLCEDWKHRNSMIILFLNVSIYGIYLMRYFSWEIFFLGAGQILFGGALGAYQYVWKAEARSQELLRQNALRDLESTRMKYQSRLESLQHLEKQVSGLLDLFEVARDFSEYLSYGGIASILQKRVRPHFPFLKMHLVMVQKKQDGMEQVLRFSITPEQVKQSDSPPSNQEHQILDQVRNSRAFIQRENQWIFPLLMDPQFCSYMVVEGTQAEDLAKFEVLSAFLTLQVKKIRLYEAVKELAIRDGLTGVFVRRHFVERFEEELRRSLKQELPLAVLMLDIDHFKRYNDEHGHLSGDVALKQVAQILVQNLRKVDIVARYGGEEFVVLIPETRKEGAVEVAERIRSHIAKDPFKIYNTVTRVSVSIGVALFSPSAKKKDAMSSQDDDIRELAFQLIQHADKALYDAKEEGRNQVVLYWE